MEKTKVFVSHSHEDKERFVNGFVNKLNDESIDVWYDTWDLGIGDSLIQKIFEEGIENAKFFFIILSKHSINSNWVKDELNSAFVKKIEEKTKILPIIIDKDIKIPTSLNHIYRIHINDLNDYESELEEISLQYHGKSKRPEKGKKPSFTEVSSLPNLNEVDTIILESIGYEVLKNNIDEIFNFDELVENIEEHSFETKTVLESLEVLENNSYIEIEEYMGDELEIQTTPIGMIFFAENKLKDFDLKFKKIISSLLDNGESNIEILEKIDVEISIINSLLKLFEINNYIKITTFTDGEIIIDDITGVGKRYFKSKLDT